MTPFDVDVEQVEMLLQMELLQHQVDDVLKSNFGEVHLQDSYMRLVSKYKYPNLINFICKMMSLFDCCKRLKKNIMKSKKTDQELSILIWKANNIAFTKY